jgi:putative transposase
MARHRRLILPGVALHVIQRGNNRNACFRGDSDYLAYLAHLRQLCAKHACSLHAYCLMTNHVHLLLTPDEESACSLLMRDLGRSYVRYFNDRHERTGTLWEGRFRSCLVESAEYVLACYRYIELNPVRASIVSRPDAYSWSSHGANTGTYPDPTVKPHAEFTALSIRAAELSTAYKNLFEQPFDDALLKTIRDATNGGYPLASDTFKARISLPRGCRTNPGRPGRPTAAAEIRT